MCCHLSLLLACISCVMLHSLCCRAMPCRAVPFCAVYLQGYDIGGSVTSGESAVWTEYSIKNVMVRAAKEGERVGPGVVVGLGLTVQSRA